MHMNGISDNFLIIHLSHNFQIYEYIFIRYHCYLYFILKTINAIITQLLCILYNVLQPRDDFFCTPSTYRKTLPNLTAYFGRLIINPCGKIELLIYSQKILPDRKVKLRGNILAHPVHPGSSSSSFSLSLSIQLNLLH